MAQYNQPLIDEIKEHARLAGLEKDYTPDVLRMVADYIEYVRSFDSQFAVSQWFAAQRVLDKVSTYYPN